MRKNRIISITWVRSRADLSDLASFSVLHQFQAFPEFYPMEKRTLEHKCSILVSIALMLSSVSSKFGLMIVGRKKIKSSVGVYLTVLGLKNFSPKNGISLSKLYFDSVESTCTSCKPPNTIISPSRIVIKDFASLTFFARKRLTLIGIALGFVKFLSFYFNFHKNRTPRDNGSVFIDLG